jgi:hypothetical protein
MPTLAKSVVPYETDVINIGIAQCSLAELMEDPLIGLVMKSDGVDRRDLELLLERVARERGAIARSEVLAHRSPRLLSNPE